MSDTVQLSDIVKRSINGDPSISITFGGISALEIVLKTKRYQFCDIPHIHSSIATVKVAIRMHVCSMRCPLEATQLEDVEVPQLLASRFAVHKPSVQLGRPTVGPISSRAFCGTTIGPGFVQRTYSPVRYSPD